MSLTSKQFAWIYLVKHGLAGAKHGFYGGYEQVGLPVVLREDWDGIWIKERHKLFVSKIKEVGVDWIKTQAPINDTHSVFVDTFHDATQAEHLEGVLILKDGTEQFWVADKIEVTSVFDMMAMASIAPDQFQELFGETV
jgi:hypothetical protein